MPFGLQDALDRTIIGASILGMASVDAQAAPVRGEFFDVGHPQPARGKYPIYGIQRQVRIMFVIDGVELGVFDQT
ncbi:hypothetical protein D3C72_2000240 [compost metagenome]